MNEDPLKVRAGPLDVRSARVDGAGERLPLAAARNTGVEIARGRFVLLLDVDCIPGAKLVGATARLLQANDVLATAPVGYLPKGAVSGPGWSEDALASVASFKAGRDLTCRPLDPLDHRLLWSLALAGRKETVAQKIGGFDEDYSGYGAEDTDFGFRARRAGVPLVWLGPYPAFHQFHHSESPPRNHLDAIIKNARLFRSKWGVWPMEGWLAAFRDEGLIAWDPDGERLVQTS